MNNQAAPVIELTSSRTPPQSVELEQAVLGAIMLEPQHAFPLAVEAGLAPDSFYLDGHGVIFELMGELHRRGTPPDAESLIDELKARGQLSRAGGVTTVLGMLTGIVSAAGIEGHARKVAEKSSLRRLIRTCTEIIDECYRQELSCDEIHTRASSLLNERVDAALAHGNSALDVELFRDSVNREVDRLLDLYDACADPETGRLPDMMDGAETGFPRLDALCGGYQPQDLVILAARPNTGKTKVAAYSMAACAKAGNKVAWINLEMPKQRLFEYIIPAVHNMSCAPGSMIERNHLYGLRSWGAMEQAAIEQARSVDDAGNILWVPKTANRSVAAIGRHIRRLAADHGVKVVFVDQLQEVDEWSASIDTNRGKVLDTIKAFRRMAMENNVAIVLLHQLRRPGHGVRDYVPPDIDDLKESGALEELASTVILLGDPQRTIHKLYGGYTEETPGQYKPPPVKESDDGPYIHYSLTPSRVIDIVLAKNRGDSTDNLAYKFDYRFGVKG